MIKILDYLTFLFEKGCEHRIIGCKISAISALDDCIDGKAFGQHPEACALDSRVFNSRPPQPRYMLVCSVESVINYFKTK